MLAIGGLITVFGHLWQVARLEAEQALMRLAMLAGLLTSAPPLKTPSGEARAATARAEVGFVPGHPQHFHRASP